VHYRKGADRCARCGSELLRVILAADLEIRSRLNWHWLTPLCGQCATFEEAAYASATGECPGCGIAMSYSPRDAMSTKWFACSERCYQRAWRRLRRIKTCTCDVCQSVFHSPRADARYCSNACRQRQYREQLALRRPRRLKTCICDVCRSLFPSPRTDSRYCSNACRQRQYRERRVAAAENGASVSSRPALRA
jgi:hypothetical protein